MKLKHVTHEEAGFGDGIGVEDLKTPREHVLFNHAFIFREKMRVAKFLLAWSIAGNIIQWLVSTGHFFQ